MQDFLNYYKSLPESKQGAIIGVSFWVIVLLIVIIKVISRPISEKITRSRYENKKQREYEKAKDRFSENSMVTAWAEEFSSLMIRGIGPAISEHKKKHWVKTIHIKCVLRCGTSSVYFSAPGASRNMVFCQLGLEDISEEDTKALEAVIRKQYMAFSEGRLKDIDILNNKGEIGTASYEFSGFSLVIQNPAYIKPEAW